MGSSKFDDNVYIIYEFKFATDNIIIKKFSILLYFITMIYNLVHISFIHIGT